MEKKSENQREETPKVEEEKEIKENVEEKTKEEKGLEKKDEVIADDAKSDSSGEDYLDVDENEINEKLNLTRDEKSEMEDLNDEDAEKEFNNFLQNLNKVDKFIV
jgi:hypothetical protein